MAKINRTKGQTTIYKTTYQTKDRVKRTPTKKRDWTQCSGRESSSSSICCTHRVALLTIMVTNFEWGRNWIVITTNGTETLSSDKDIA